jgi:hypothetical protein
MMPIVIYGYPGMAAQSTVLSIADGYTGGCVSLLNPTPRIISSTGAVTTVATMTTCGLPSLAKPLWNFYKRAISDLM